MKADAYRRAIEATAECLVATGNLDYSRIATMMRGAGRPTGDRYAERLQRIWRDVGEATDIRRGAAT